MKTYNENTMIDVLVESIVEDLISNATTKAHMQDAWNGDYYQYPCGIDYTSSTEFMYGDIYVKVTAQNGYFNVESEDEDVAGEIECWLDTDSIVERLYNEIAA